jgi:hypothetical protein
VNATTATVLRPGANEVGLAVINRVLPTYRLGLHAPTTTPQYLQHEADRLEALPKSLISDAMRASVDAERTWRRHLARMGGRA